MWENWLIFHMLAQSNRKNGRSGNGFDRMLANMDSPYVQSQHQNLTNENVSSKIKQWNRAIPEAGYITLGTIRYGVKLTGTPILSRSKSANTNLLLRPGRTPVSRPAPSTQSDDRSSVSTTDERSNCCCGRTCNLVYSWNNNNNARTRLPVPLSVQAKNRTSSTSSSTTPSSLPSPSSSSPSSRSSSATTTQLQRQQRSVETAGGCLVIENRESSPPLATCCCSSSSCSNGSSSSSISSSNNNGGISSHHLTTAPIENSYKFYLPNKQSGSSNTLVHQYHSASTGIVPNSNNNHQCARAAAKSNGPPSTQLSLVRSSPTTPIPPPPPPPSIDVNSIDGPTTKSKINIYKKYYQSSEERVVQEEQHQRPQKQHRQQQQRRTASLSSSPSKSVDILVECASDLKFNNSSDKNGRGSEEAANIQNVVTNGCCSSSNSNTDDNNCNSSSSSSDHTLELLNCCRAYSAAESEYRFPVPHGHNARSANKSCSIVGKLATALRKNIVHDSAYKPNTTAPSSAANRPKTKITQSTESKHRCAGIVGSSGGDDDDGGGGNDGCDASVAVANDQLGVKDAQQDKYTDANDYVDIVEARRATRVEAGGVISHGVGCNAFGDDLSFIDSCSSASGFVNVSTGQQNNGHIGLNSWPKIDSCGGGGGGGGGGDRIRGVVAAATIGSRRQPPTSGAKNIVRASCDCGTVVVNATTTSIPANIDKCAKCRKRIKELHSIANAYSETVSAARQPSSREFGSLGSAPARPCPIIVKATFCDPFESSETDCGEQTPHYDDNRRVVTGTTTPSLKAVDQIDWNKARSSHENLTMEKRRKTMDRWQRLGFGRRSTSNPPPDEPPAAVVDPKKGVHKTERLKELTELLKGSRAPQMPPIPPPRKPRSPSSTLLPTEHMSAGSSKEEIHASTSKTELYADNYSTRIPLNGPLPESLPSSSLRPMSCAAHTDEMYSTADAATANDDDMFTALPKVESRTIMGAYAQKNIPYRSASFSQVDYSSGKYIRSALGALKASLKKHKEASVVDSANLTLPRKKDEPIPSKMSVDRNCDHVASECDVITSTEPNTHFENDFSVPAPCSSLSDDVVDEDQIPETIEYDVNYSHHDETDLFTCGSANDTNATSGLVVVKASEMILDTLSEEEILIDPTPQEEFLQTATTCLIPVPVYECVSRDWPSKESPDKWIDANEEEDHVKLIEDYHASLENVDQDGDRSTIPSPPPLPPPNTPPQASISSLSEENFVITQAAEQYEQLDHCEENPLTSVLVAPNSVEAAVLGVCNVVTEVHHATSSSDEVDKVPVVSLIVSIFNENDELDAATDDVKDDSSNLSTEYVEVRKRHSNEDRTDKPLESTANSLESVNSNQANNEDRRRIDKSKRRKGIYFQWPQVDKQCTIDAEEWNPSLETISPTDAQPPSTSAIWHCDPAAETPATEIDLQNCDFSTFQLPPPENVERPNMFLLCKTPDGSQTPGSIGGGIFEPTTPDSDNCQTTITPVWPKVERRKSLVCQSSEEKDDAPLSASPSMRSFQNIQFLRSESISDNESDHRTPPRERSSQSPAPYGDQDPKRYSKRPLRGPYGQMLEAEMKKPAKVHYNSEVMDSFHPPGSAPAKGDDDAGRQSAVAKANRKNTGYLPVPSHIRASSTPVNTDSPRKDLVSSHRRFPSSIDSSTCVEMKKTAKKPIFDVGSQDAMPKKYASFDASSDKGIKRIVTAPNLIDRKLTYYEHSHTPKKSGVATPELLAEMLKGSSEKLTVEQNLLNRVCEEYFVSIPEIVLQFNDTRTHVVIELFNTEHTYVQALFNCCRNYLEPLKSPEFAGIVDGKTVDDIFLMVPTLLYLHDRFLIDLKNRLELWDLQRCVGDVFIDSFSKSTIVETYATFVNNWNRAKNAIRATCASRPAFGRFLEAMSRQHKGKLSLDNLLIKPVQKFPNYELIISRLIKHTDPDHPDQKPLQDALKLVHDILLQLNCEKRESEENGQRDAVLRELEGVIEGMSELVVRNRQFILFELVSVVQFGQAARKERALFLFSDLLVVTSIKRRSGTIRRPNSACPGSVASTLDTNKYKFIMKISVEDLEIVNAKDENLRKMIKEIENLTEDFGKLQQIADVTSSLRCHHQALEETIKDMQRDVQKQLADRKSTDSPLNQMELVLNMTNDVQHWSVMFSKSEKKNQWEQVMHNTKQKLIASQERHPVPEFMSSIPIRKTRAGLQFTCAAPTLGVQKDVWVCNSDGYVGQVCVLSLLPEPTVTSCNGVCNARILCVASVPTTLESATSSRCISISIEDPMSPTHPKGSTNHFSRCGFDKASVPPADSSSSCEDSDNDNAVSVAGAPNKSSAPTATSAASATTAAPSSSSTGDPLSDDVASDHQQSTMWLGTEDGCVHVYNCTDNIRIKKNKIKIQHVSAVYSIMYLDNRVFVSLANGELMVYLRQNSRWNTTTPLTVHIGSVTSPVTRLLNVHGKLWCSIQGSVKIIDTSSLKAEKDFKVSDKLITEMVVSKNSVWISLQNSAVLECYHCYNHLLLFKVNLAPQVTKMLSNCDDIIKQHKAACLRVTSLLACRELVWVGTSAGVLLTISAVQMGSGMLEPPIVTGLPHGHTGHVRFLTSVDYEVPENATKVNSKWNTMLLNNKPDTAKVLIISGGDGYEDFRNAGANPLSDGAGREDSTNHLLLWHL